MLEDSKPQSRTSNFQMEFVARGLYVDRTPNLAGTASQSSTLAIADVDEDEPMGAVTSQTSAADMEEMD